jgi:DNA-binding HxlR family transcriptional regulator
MAREQTVTLQTRQFGNLSANREQENQDTPILPSYSFSNCPIQTSLGVLGKKWTLLILRDIGLLKIDRFNRILETLPGLPRKVLSTRLKELEREGFIECSERKKSPMVVRWTMTQKGKDTLPILMRFIAFGSRWYPDTVFPDKTPRTLGELFTTPEAKEIIEGYT